MRTRSFFSPVHRGLIRNVSVHLVQNIFRIIAVLIDFLSANRGESNLMRTITKQDSNETQKRQCNWYQRDSNAIVTKNQHTKEQDQNRKSARQGEERDNSDNSTQQIYLLDHFQAIQ